MLSFGAEAAGPAFDWVSRLTKSSFPEVLSARLISHRLDSTTSIKSAISNTIEMKYCCRRRFVDDHNENYCSFDFDKGNNQMKRRELKMPFPEIIYVNGQIERTALFLFSTCTIRTSCTVLNAAWVKFIGVKTKLAPLRHR